MNLKLMNLTATVQVIQPESDSREASVADKEKYP